MLTHKQKAFAAYFLAIIDLFLSLVLWTRVLAVQQVTPLSPVEEQTVILQASEPVTTDNSAQQKAIHRAAPAFAEVSKKSEQEPVDLPESPKPVDERTQWGLTRRYALSIPSLSVHVPVFVPERTYWDARQWDLLEQQMQIGLLYGAVAYPHSVTPGARGALIIAGHSSPPTARAEESAFGRVFAHLPDLRVGDEIVVRFGTTSVSYTVEDKQVVSARNTSILANDGEEPLLKLITCYPVGSVKDRMVIIARPTGEFETNAST